MIRKINRKIALIGFVAISTSSIGQYTIEKYSINSGGGTLSDSQYQVQGSIAQTDASSLMEDTSNPVALSVQGGFWAKSTINPADEEIFNNSFE